jgi:hypothetical protein
MNRRIQELAEQAEKYADDNFRGEPSYSEAYDSKFAELIVRECLNIVDDAERGGSNEVWDNAVKFIRRDIKEHFGVR